MTKPITQLMQKDMSRKEFMATMGFGVASLFGFSTVVHLLTGKSFGSMHGLNQSNNGYGGSKYGL